MHPMYHQACGLIGQQVTVHAYGRIHHGIMHHVTADGVYLQPNGGAMMSFPSDERKETDTVLIPITVTDTAVQPEPVFWPFLFLPFLAIAALGPWWWW